MAVMGPARAAQGFAELQAEEAARRRRATRFLLAILVVVGMRLGWRLFG